jgi:hypothetical protein
MDADYGAAAQEIVEEYGKRAPSIGEKSQSWQARGGRVRWRSRATRQAEGLGGPGLVGENFGCNGWVGNAVHWTEQT